MQKHLYTILMCLLLCNTSVCGSSRDFSTYEMTGGLATTGKWKTQRKQGTAACTKLAEEPG